jgi:F0F1-type ATP synthase membrane subunit b/b'
MEWIQELQTLTPAVAVLVIFVVLFKIVLDSVTRGFTLAIEARDATIAQMGRDIESLRDEVKDGKAQGSEERKELQKKIEVLEQASQSDIHQKLDLILQKV